VINKTRLEQIGLLHRIPELLEAIEQMGRLTTDLQNIVMKVRMVPIKQVFNRFPRMVRDLSRELNKDVRFIIEGQDTELDRTVIDEIGDPLVHLIRNALDHGIENPDERIKAGKERTAMLRLAARQDGNNVVIEVEDDGRGIDIEKIRKKAVENGLLTEKEAEDAGEDELLKLIFQPGFSTADAITDLSGRGVGMDVVKSKIESLNGSISIETRKNIGTKVSISLPLTLAIIQALLVSVGKEQYAIPLSSIDETTFILPEDIKTVKNQEVMLLRGTVLPLLRLEKLLDVPTDGRNNEELFVVVVRKGERRFGLVVDQLVGQQEIVIKSLGQLLNGIRGIAGATILGNGQVSLILDVNSLV
ncbi:MAG: chemotaxis protein CheA, partial [Thermacetogeniaceae bacterium]